MTPEEREVLKQKRHARVERRRLEKEKRIKHITKENEEYYQNASEWKFPRRAK